MLMNALTVISTDLATISSADVSGHAHFITARMLLAGTLERLSEKEAHHVRSALAQALLEIAQAGSAHFISIHHIDKHERPLLHEIAHDLQLGTTGEGLHLLEQ